MGCDIHGFCEVKQNGVWKLNDKKVFKNPYYLSPEELEERKKNQPDYEMYDWQMEEFDNHPPTSRNYDWFAILADVRNGRGFAGVSTGDGFDIISEPKGVPDDATEEWWDEVNRWRGDMHSHSHLSLEDFDSFNWLQITRKCGVIPLNEYKELAGTNGTPSGWSGSISGPNIVTVDEESADKILAGETVVVELYDPFARIHGRKPNTEIVSLETGHSIHVIYTWAVLYSEWFENSIKNVIEPMRKLKEEYEDVRYVFGFDN
jgi:hypothetical protein